MESYIGTIMIWPLDWAPQDWLICAGQELPINQYSALYSLLGQTYGGNGSTTFRLPDLRSRVPVGAGQGTGLSQYALAAKGGAEQVQLTQNNLPIHNHTATVSTSGLTCSASGTFKISATSTLGNVSIPDENSALAQAKAGPATATIYNNNTSVAKDVQIAGGTVNVSGTVGGAATVTVNNAGLGQAVTNLQPYVALNYIICVQGLYPMRP